MKKLLVALLVFPVAALASITSQVAKTGPVTVTSLPQTIASGFPFQSSGDLLVLDAGSSTSGLRDPAAVLTLGSDYTVTGGGYNGSNQMQTGSISVVGSGSHNVLVNDNIIIMRNSPFTQLTSFGATGPLTISLIEQALDKATVLSQQLNEVGSRSLQFENFEVEGYNNLNSGANVLSLANRAGKYLGFDSYGNPGFYGSTSGSTTVTPGGSNGQIQYNSSGSFGGTNGMTWSGTALINNQSTSGPQSLFQSQNTNPATNAYGIISVGNNLANTVDISITSSAWSGVFATNGPTGQQGAIYTIGSFPLDFGVNFGSSFYIDTNNKTNFTPSANYAAVNLGTVAGDPSTVANGDLWYSSSAPGVRMRVAGTTYTIPTSAGGGTTTNALTFNTTGGAAAGTTFNGSAAVTVSPVTIGAGSLTTSNSWSGASNTFTYVNINDQLALGLTGLSIGSPSSSAGSTATVTPQTVTVSGTIPGQFQGLYYGAPTFTDASSATLPIAATITINGAPIAGGSLAITNPYALYIPSGNVDIVGSAFLGSGSTAVTQTAGDNTTKIATDAFVLANAGGGSPPTNGYAYRNLLLNGDMRIDQQNAGASVTVNSTSENFSVDQWVGYGVASAGVFTLQQSTSTPPAGFTNFLRATCSTADSSPAAGSVYVLENKVEGVNCQGLAEGTASATSVTLSFQVRSSLTGAFSGAISNGTGYSYPFSFTISTANTWTPITLTAAGATAGTWLTAVNTVGLVVDVDLGSGSTALGTAGAWTAALKTGVTSSARLMGTTSATLDLTSVQLETGTASTPFERIGYQEMFSNCERYLWRNQLTTSSGMQEFGLGWADQTTDILWSITLPVDMCGSPTVTQSAASNFSVTVNTTTVTPSVVSIFSVGPKYLVLRYTVPTVTQGAGAMVNTASTTTFIQAAARL